MTRPVKETNLMPSVQRVLWSAVLICAALWAFDIRAQDTPNEALLENDKIVIEYVKPGEQHLMGGL